MCVLEIGGQKSTSGHSSEVTHLVSETGTLIILELPKPGEPRGYDLCNCGAQLQGHAIRLASMGSVEFFLLSFPSFFLPSFLLFFFFRFVLLFSR